MSEGVVAGGGQTRCWPCHVGGDAVGDQAATLHVPVIHRAVTDGPMWFRLKAALGFRRTELLTCRQGLGLRTCGGSEVGRRPEAVAPLPDGSFSRTCGLCRSQSR